jgi:predicted alpha/beta hydrolase family esterase
MAADWGASVVMAGPRGHLNADSGLGDWPEGRELLLGL